MIEFYTDGACNGNKSGGWAFYCPDLDLIVSGKEKDTTNNRMELTAILKVIEFIHLCNLSIKEVTINSDSAWSIGAITKNWNLKENIDLVQQIQDLRLSTQTDFIFNKVKGHCGIKGNEIVDQIAVIMSNL